MKKKISLIVLLFFGTIAILTQLKPKQANAWIAGGYYMAVAGECTRCEPATHSCNVSNQCCSYWPECNEGLETR